MAQIAFILITGFVFFLAFKKYRSIYNNIQLGMDSKLEGNSAQRWKNVLLIAFGQKKMFKRWVPAILHGFIYVAFLFTQIELIEIIIDGIFGTHRIFAAGLGILYTVILNSIEFLSIGAFIATLIFLARRNLLRLPRFHKDEMTGWPKLDGNLILYGEILLLVGVFTMNGADHLLQKIDPVHYPATGFLPVSAVLSTLFEGFSTESLMFLERAGWWLHLLVVYAFILYLPHSKHLHIFLAFPNTYFANLRSRGEMENMPEIMNEVKSMMGLLETSEEAMDAELPEFGSNDVVNLSWRNILEAYTCTECGRCTSECPANITGKKLSPRKIMMDVRDRAEEIGEKIKSADKNFIKEGSTEALTKDNFQDGKSLFDYISKEEIHACTSCNACVEACPVLINPLDIILKLRRYEILSQSEGPQEWLPMFNSIENSGAVWQVPEQRADWTNS